LSIIDSKIKIVVDPKAGFCGGVKRAIKLVERELNSGNEIFARGELIHNEREMKRLYEKGLKVCEELDSSPCQTLFIRTHGEAPETYHKSEDLGVDLIDATCRNVRRSQEIISKNADEGRNIYIFGKKRHPEVIGLLGYCKGKGMVFQNAEDISTMVDNVPSLLIPQTTADPFKFEAARKKLNELITDLEVYNAICPFVSQRDEELFKFASEYNAVVFVGGKHSSNTAVLFEVCKKSNPNSFFAEYQEELPYDKLMKFKSIGISGSASTPMWQLEEIAKAIRTKTALLLEEEIENK
jgi:4-hydroxy-3-methylbut-2-enyl diphosphate reductase